MAIGGTLAFLYAGSLVDHARYAWQPFHANDDARQQIWPFLRYHDPQLLRGDFIAAYYLDSLPPGFWSLYRLAATVVDPRIASKALPYVELLIVLLALGTAAWRLGGATAAWGTMALALSTGVLLDRLAGGLPRSFAFPLMAASAAALVHGRPWILASCSSCSVRPSILPPERCSG